MDAQELRQLVREHYPFPIAYAYKKTLGVLDDNVEKLKCLLETAEATIQFLALLALAQVRQDLLNSPLTPIRQAQDRPPRMGTGPQTPPFAPSKNIPDLNRLREELKLATPSFGKWNRMAREAMKAYRDVTDQLVVPELFDFFWVWNPDRQKLYSQPLDNKVIGPLITLRNAFHHGRVPDDNVRERVTEGLQWLHQLLETIQFLTQYQLSFTQQIVIEDALQKTYYIHDLTVFNGCVSMFDRNRWRSEMRLKSGSVILLHSQAGRHVLLSPFMTFTNQIRRVPDLFLLNNVVKKKAIYVSCQFGEVLETKDDNWTDGTRHHEALGEFLDLLQNVPQTSSCAGVSPAPAPVEEEEIDSDRKGSQARTHTGHAEEDSTLSTAEVFDQKYRAAEQAVQHTSPYKFLDYYNPEDHDIFFGRDKEIRILQQKFYNSRLLVLHGESGTGKTSLIRAGLIPLLDPESYIPVYVRVLKEPLREIQRELIHQLRLDDQFVVRHAAERSAVGEERYSTSLRSVLQTITERVSKTVVIVLDQFEEFFLRFPEEVREQLKKELAECVETPRLDVKVLIALRADYFSYLAAFESSIPHIFTHQLQLERLTEAQALEAVIKPAERLGIEVEEPMVQIKLLPELLSEEGTIEPPFLQIVCDALSQHAQSEGRNEIGMADYEAIGDVKGCLGTYLSAKLRQFGKHQGTAKAVLKAFVTTEGTKRASFVEELLSRMKSTYPSPQPFPQRREGAQAELSEEELKTAYLDKFVRDRLLRVEDVEGRARYELSHEYLVTHIGDWIEESEREVTKVLEVIDRAYEAYQATDLLLERSALQMIRPFEEQVILPPDKQAFVDRSITQARKTLRGLLLKVAVLLLSVALIVGGIFGYLTYQQYQETIRQRDIAIAKQQETERQARIAQARQLAVQAQNVFENSPQRSLLLAVEALNITLRKGEPHVPAAEEVLRDVLAKTGGIVLHGQEEGVSSVAISPNSHWLVTGSKDATAWLWDLTASDPVVAPLVLRGHEGKFTRVAFSPDNHWLVTVGDEDSTTRLWDLTAADPAATALALHGHEGKISHVTVSPDSRWLATAGYEDTTARLWDLTATDPAATSLVLRDHEEAFTRVAFSPNSRWLVTGSYDDTARLWDLTAPDPAATFLILRGHELWVENVVFSLDSRWLVTFSHGRDDYTARLWNLSVDDPAAAPVIVVRSGHDEGRIHAVISPDSHWLVTYSYKESDNFRETTARLWDLNATDPAITSVVLRGHEKGIRRVAFSPNSRWLVTGSDDHTARLWDLTAPDPAAIPVVLRGHEGKITNMTVSSDNHWLITGSSDATARLWDLTTADPAAGPVVLRGHKERITHLTLSSDSHRLVTGSWDNTHRLWDLTALDPAADPIVLRGHEGRFGSSAKISPDNHWLVTNSSDGIARLWDLTTSDLAATPLVLRGHEKGIRSVAVSPDGRWLVSGSLEGAARLWDLTAENPAAGPLVLHGHKGDISHMGDFSAEDISHVAVSPDSHWLVTASYKDTTARLWDLRAENPATAPLVLRGHTTTPIMVDSPNNVSGVLGITSITISPDNHWLVTSGDTTARLWDLTAENPAAAPLTLHHERPVGSVAISPDGRWLATSDMAGAITPNGYWLLSYDDTVRLWDLTAENPAAAPPLILRYGKGIKGVTFSSDGHWLAIMSFFAVGLWDLRVENPAVTPFALHHEEDITSMAVSPDSHWLVAGGIEGTARLWDLTEANPAVTSFVLRGHESWIRSVAVSPDSHWLITGSTDATARLWDLTAENPATTSLVLRGHEEVITSVAVSPDSHWLITGSGDKTVRLWTLWLDELIDLACRTAGRNLSHEEWQQYFPGEEYRIPCSDLPIHHSVISNMTGVARHLARIGDIKGAIAIFQRVVELSDDSNFDPETEAYRVAAEEAKRLMREGDQLSEEGRIKEAIAIFFRAKELDYSSYLDYNSYFDPETRAYRLATKELIAEGERLSEEGQIKEAIAAYEKAQTLDPSLEISDQFWGALCWYGILSNSAAAEVMNACERISSARGAWHPIAGPVRGLARALNDDIDGAIKDFQAIVDWTDWTGAEELKLEYQRWLDVLHAGENPFTPEELERLRRRYLSFE